MVSKKWIRKRDAAEVIHLHRRAVQRRDTDVKNAEVVTGIIDLTKWPVAVILDAMLIKKEEVIDGQDHVLLSGTIADSLVDQADLTRRDNDKDHRRRLHLHLHRLTMTGSEDGKEVVILRRIENTNGQTTDILVHDEAFLSHLESSSINDQSKTS